VRHLFDNDFVIKLAQLDLLEDACSIIGATPSNTDHLATLPYVARRKFRRKSKQSERNQESLNRITDWCHRYKNVLESRVSEILEQANRSLAIDPGEAILLAEAVDDPEVVIFTGDKRCVRALGTEPGLRSIALALRGRVQILESIILRLIDGLGFEAVKQYVLAADSVNGMLDIAFRTDEARRDIHALEALKSAESELERGCPGLIRR
jgi:hypothetical protein